MSPQSSFGKFRLFLRLFSHLVNPNESIDSVTTFFDRLFRQFFRRRAEHVFPKLSRIKVNFLSCQERSHEKSRNGPLQLSLQFLRLFYFTRAGNSALFDRVSTLFPTFLRLFSVSLRLKDFLTPPLRLFSSPLQCDFLENFLQIFKIVIFLRFQSFSVLLHNKSAQFTTICTRFQYFSQQNPHFTFLNP